VAVAAVTGELAVGQLQLQQQMLQLQLLLLLLLLLVFILLLAFANFDFGTLPFDCVAKVYASLVASCACNKVT